MHLTRNFALLALAPLLLMQVANAQTPIPAPPAAPPPTSQPGVDPNIRFMEEVMRTANAVHALIRGMNLEKTLGPQNSYPPGDPRALQRTAEFMGMGAGAGIALGEMTQSQKAVMIGAVAGSAGGLILDQFLRHQAAKNQALPQQ